MKKLILIFLFIPIISFSQKKILKNGISVTSPIEYSYDSKLSTDNKAHYLSDKKEELLVYVFKIKEIVTEEMIDKMLLSENASIKWKLFDGPSDDKWSTISQGIMGIYGYRTAFMKNGKLIMIQSFCLSYHEALKIVAVASEKIKSDN